MSQLRASIEMGRSRHSEELRVSKADAIRLGLNVYWTGKPCAAGHLAHRRVQNGFCVECNDKSQTEYSRKRAAIRSGKECAAAGIDMEKRRAIEELREARRLERELEDFE